MSRSAAGKRLRVRRRPFSAMAERSTRLQKSASSASPRISPHPNLGVGAQRANHDSEIGDTCGRGNRDYEYILIGNQILIVDPRTLRIVAVIPA
jgi:hypothetical protein